MEDQHQPFNSSDVEFSPVHKKYRNAGLTSIVSMRETLFEDRISSKKKVRNLTDDRGAPASRYARSLWLNRMEGYMRENQMELDPQTGPDCVTLVRFLDTVVKHIRARGDEAPVPLRSSIRRGVSVLCSALIFEFPKFSLSKHDCSRVDALIDGLADDGQLRRGRHREQYQWIGVSLVEKMSRSWLQAALDNGCLSWDIVIHKALTLVLQSALLCRAGEIAKSKLYTVEFMRWRDMVMTLPLGADTLDDVQLTCLLRFEKGKKYDRASLSGHRGFGKLTGLFRWDTNTDRDVPLQTLRNPALNVICPIKLLLVQALRSGNIVSLDDALTQASLRRDRTIEWLYPQRPVIPQLVRDTAFIAWDRPAGTNQVNKSTKELGLAAGILASIVSHDLRRGGFRDLANVKRSADSVAGVATREVAKVGGHSAHSYSGGVTDKYVGEVENDAYTPRAEQMFVSRKTPLIGNAYKKRRLTTTEIDTYCQQNNIDPTFKPGRGKAGRQIHGQQKIGWMESEKAQGRTPSIPSPTTVSTSNPASVKSTTTTTLPSSSLMPISTKIINSSASTVSSIPIDPLLLLHDEGDVAIQDEGDVAIQDAAAERLDSLVYDNVAEPEAEEQAVGLQFFLENADDARKTSILTLPGREFVEALSKINIVRHNDLAQRFHALDALFPVHCPMGHSRDYPSLFRFQCEICDDYGTRSKIHLNVHRLVCKGKAVVAENKKEKLFPCDQEGCGFVYALAKQLQEHIDSVHQWKPRRCNVPGCTNERLFESRIHLIQHVQFSHRPIEPPMRCTYIGCTSTTLWGQMENYTAHLRLRHHLFYLAERKPYLPQNRLHQTVSTSSFQSTVCPIGGSPACGKLFKRPEDLTRHMTGAFHGMRVEGAKRITRGAEVDPEVESSVGGENSRSKKDVTSSFQSTACPIGGSPACGKVYKRPADLTRHLTRGIHDLGLEAAQRITRGEDTEPEV
ncbi:hypothetical protein MMC27_005103 [Xylographa pallens]|nr:hypothetical protein [Xylographa pallens]